jgi:hypothetical protein
MTNIYSIEEGMHWPQSTGYAAPSEGTVADWPDDLVAAFCLDVFWRVFSPRSLGRQRRTSMGTGHFLRATSSTETA